MYQNALVRLLTCLFVFIAFFECFVPVRTFSQSILESTNLRRSKRQVALVELNPRQSYGNRTSNAYVPNYLQTSESGPWGPWTQSSQCSRTCGGGVAHQDRICMDLRPDGRHSCTGLSRRYFSCNTQDCPHGSREFRDVQCSRFNTVPHHGRCYSWIAYHNPHSPCELYCSPKGGNSYQRVDATVIDGTRCRNDGSLDICVEGECMPVGCDSILGSTKSEDQCGVCGGDGTGCSINKGVFDGNDLEVGYNDILLIPIGATSILIRNTEGSRNYLAVRNTEGTYYLNGNWRIDFPTVKRFAGTVFQYERKPQGTETLRAKGPITEAVFIVLLYQERNRGIDYEYAVPVATRTPSPDSYVWTTGDFEQCSQTCGGGIQARPVRCLREGDRDIADERLCDPLTKPNVNVTCNNEACPSSWKIGEWSECTKECGGGSQYRVVYCHQQKDGNTVLVADETCEGEKPLFMRSCNLDKECPDWVVGEWSECDSQCGSGSQNRSVECQSKETKEVLEDDQCDSKTRPDNEQTCSLGPCEGVEWIVSDWSGCDGSCSPRMESREVHCANEEGAVFPNDACESKMPELTRPCPKSEMCDPMWHTSEWTECSVKCGNGVQSRVVFCGAWQDDAVIKIEDKMCDPDKQFEDMQNCSADSCQGIWFTGPWDRCSVPCGGGERSRKILCFHENEVVENSQCEPTEQPFDTEPCNMTPCDDDEIMTVGGCKSTKYGCCPDGMTPAGLNYEGCSNLNISSTNVSCEEAEFGCCSDGFTLALGPFKKGCPSTINCTETKHGCCPDEKTVAKGPNFEGCPEEVNCLNSTYGCCDDNVTAATGPNLEGCPDTGECFNSTFGCCDDGFTAATGPDGEGCEREGSGRDILREAGLDILREDIIDSSGEDCYGLTFGCCPDGLTPASGPDQEGCDEVENGTDCKRSAFGCCGDGMTPATGPMKGGCPEFEDGSGDDSMIPCELSIFGCCPDNITAAKGFEGEGCEGCDNSTFGCCPDNITAAAGPNGTGCFPEDCSNSTFGCCPDNMTLATGPDGEGCAENCSESLFGCCQDNVTFALGPDGEGCEPEDCSNTTYGCCPDNMTIATGPDNEGCGPEDCSNTTYGCCPDNMTIASGPDNEGCEPEDCTNTTYGCCPDNMTIASGPDYEGCENETDCSMSEFGCCPDNVTVALGDDFEGCNDTSIVTTEMLEITTTPPPPECLNTLYGCCPDEVTTALGPNLEGCCFGMRFGCCPDNKTAALGPNYLGCGCQTYPFGCCPDNISPAQGPNFRGCRCEHFRYGCCQDNITPAKGPQYQGCECQFMYYGCCPDGLTPVLNDKGDGCGCDSTHYGCCPDGRTAATSPDLSGCPCETLPYGCCPDGHTPARTSDLRDCPCEAQFYGCCLDGRTIARGPNYEGCSCESTRFGCCQDGRTTAQGPGFEGCPCEMTSYGCCADSYTPAKGPRFEGCPDVVEPKPTVSTEVCSLPKEPGPCRNYTIKWFFDVAYGGCSRFWYGGCDGNGNSFATQEDCERVCVKPEGPAVCLLPMVAGSCEGKIHSWYFDAGSKNCETFTYGGCLGNNNRFSTKTDCEARCISKQPTKAIDKCSLPKDEGGCDSAIIKWYYSAENSRCEQFYYGGCKGNANRFESRRECEKSCMPSVIKETDICRLPFETGPCNEFRERWYFDYESAQCHRFMFGGCNGNENNFGSFPECEKRCGRDDSSEPPVELEFKTEYCFQIQDVGPCSSTELNWFYDSSDGVCKEFYYGGCKGNRNRFKTRKECEKSCFKAQDVCNLPAVKGPCSGSFPQWYYDKNQDDCHEFSFSGCQGNANRFNNKESCYQRCKKEPVTIETPSVTSDVCSLPKEPGPCLGYYRSWYYDGSDNTCRSFIYGGCDGNENRFEKRRACEQRCVKKAPKEPGTLLPEQPTRTDNEDVCRLPVDPGQCQEEHPRWFYDAQTQSCLPFIFGGCNGNKNRFKTAEICLRFCTGVKAKPGSDEVPYVTPSTTTTTTTTTAAPTQCPPSNCAEIRCPYGIEEAFDTNGCSSCRCSNPCEVHTCPEGSRCAIDVVRTSGAGVRTEPVCRRIEKPGVCPPVAAYYGSGPRDCETRCRDDAHCRGEHKCCNNSCALTCMPPADEPFVAASQPEPATILPGVNVTKGEVGQPAELPCNARGWPRPTVTWWRDTTMLPLSSRRYEQLPNYALLIRSVVYEDGGDYSCHAHNGIGSGATYKVTLIIDFQPELARGDENDVNPRDSEPEPPPSNPWVPVAAAVNLVTSNPVAGSPLQIDCTTEGPPSTKVIWQFADSLLIVDDKRRILSNHTLFITKADIDDTGEYRCTAQFQNNVATSSVYVLVKPMPTESACIDNPQFKNCNIIVSNNYCSNKYYGKFCCASCMKAGQIVDIPQV